MSTWLDYVLDPNKLAALLSETTPENEVLKELCNFLTSILNHQNNGFFSENPQELCYAEAEEKKVSVLRGFCLRIAASCDWCLGKFESMLSPPLLLYLLQSLLQSQPDQTKDTTYRLTQTHMDMDLSTIPGPALHAISLFHRWVVRAFMASRTPARAERSPVMSVPGLLRDPALVYRDQTNSLISAVAPTSIKFLQKVLDSGVTPDKIPSQTSFSLGTNLAVPSWVNLNVGNANTFTALLSYDLGCCYFFCEDYSKARLCFSKFLAISDRADTACVNKALLGGYLAALDMKPHPEQNLQTKLIKCKDSGYGSVDQKQNNASVLDLLEEDNKTNKLLPSQRENLEMDISVLVSKGTVTTSKDFLPVLMIQNLLKRSLRGLPITQRTVAALHKQSDKVVRAIEEKVMVAIKRASPAEHLKLKVLVQELYLHQVISDTSPLLIHFSLNPRDIGFSPRSCSISPGFSLVSDTHGMDKIAKLNTSLQLLVSFSPSQVSSMARSVRLSRKTSQRWHLEDHLARAAPGLSKSNGGAADLVYILLAKTNQLKKMGCFSEARGLLGRVQAELGGGKSGDRALQQLPVHVGYEQLVVDLLEAGEEGRRSQDLVNRAGQCLSLTPHNQDQFPAPPVVEVCLATLLNSGDWDGVIRLTTNRPGLLPVLARNLAHLMINLRTNNPQAIKKFCRELWDLITPLVSTGANKRGKENGAVFASVKERASLTMFLGQLQVPGLVNLVLSLLAAMHNAARDDPSTEILPTYVTLWPTGLSSNVTLQDRQVDDVLTAVLTAALKNSPKDPQFLRMMADLQYANSHYASALALYVETASVKTEFFQLDCGPTVLEDTAIMRMVRCCTELGRLTQAVVLMQFTPDPNYAQAFKYLEDRESADGSDSLYGCIWDMAILEFAMSLHNRRGEVARRQQALNCIMQLELNTNNEEEIQKEAAKIRKAMFLRALALQFF